MTLEQFIKDAQITLTSQIAPTNPHMDDPSYSMDHYRVKLRCPASTMRLYFSKGSGHHGQPPTVNEVLDCLAMDASGVDNAGDDFEQWCGEYGYDVDSRKAEKTFKTCAKQAARLRQFLGEDAYDQLLWHIERD